MVEKTLFVWVFCNFLCNFNSNKLHKTLTSGSFIVVFCINYATQVKKTREMSTSLCSYPLLIYMFNVFFLYTPQTVFEAINNLQFTKVHNLHHIYFESTRIGLGSRFCLHVNIIKCH